MRKLLLPTLVTVLTFLGVFTATAHAAAAVDPGPDPTSLWDLMRPIYEAFASGHFLWAGAVALTVGVALTKRYLVPSTPFLRTEAGSAVLVLLGSLGATLASSLAGGVVFHWAMLSTALKIAFLSAGGFSAVKHLVIEPYKNWIANLGPEWMHRPMALVLWAFDELPDPTPSELVQTAMSAVDSPDRRVTVSVSTSENKVN